MLILKNIYGVTMKHSIALCALMGSLAAAPSVHADGFYFGLGLGGTSAKSDAVLGGLGTSELKTAVVGLTGGYRWALASGFAAAELDADISLESAFKNTATGATCPKPPCAMTARMCWNVPN